VYKNEKEHKDKVTEGPMLHKKKSTETTSSTTGWEAGMPTRQFFEYNEHHQ
jgi:hypothetical protein